MKRLVQGIFGVAVALSFATAMAKRPDEGKYPNLVKSWEAIQNGKKHLEAAEKAHAAHGGLGGHANAAVKHINAAELELDEAVMFADTHTKPGKPGVVTPKPPLTARPDDVKYPNLGDAHLDCEWAIRHIEDAMQYHGPTGTLGGHGEKAQQHVRAAQKEIIEAEHFADTHK